MNINTLNKITNAQATHTKPYFSKTIIRPSIIALSVLVAMGCAGPDSANTEAKDTKAQTAQTNSAKMNNAQTNNAQKVESTENDEQHAVAIQLPADIILVKPNVQRLYAPETEAMEMRASHDVFLAPASEAVGNTSLSNTRHRMQEGKAMFNKAHAPIPHQPILDVGQSVVPNTENYQNIDENTVKVTRLEPVSTFSIDVDTGSYTNTRRMLNQGILPPADAVRAEEFINYFDFDYPVPQSLEHPFSVTTTISDAPWNAERHLLRVGLQAYTPDAQQSAGSNLVFLLDVSGSMNQADKLPLLKRSLKLLSSQLDADDKVSIVVYAGASGVVLEPTDGDDQLAIADALDKLAAGGSTNGAAGIEQAYRLAEQAFIAGGVNRVILATDGDFNVGMVNHDALIKLIETKREKGIALTTLGFGQGNYNDYLMEQLANAGNGNYAYIDNINEARKVLVDELQSTMQIVAKDVKIQVEFNPAAVAEYRLIGYENRALANEDFNNDSVDAGEIGAGHSVTALYELSLVGSDGAYNDELRYSSKSGVDGTNTQDLNSLVTELAHVKLRYKAPDEDSSQLIEHIVQKSDIGEFSEQDTHFQFATAVAGFAQKVKGSKYASDMSYEWISDTAQNTKGDDRFGYRSEFIQLVENAKHLSASTALSHAHSENLTFAKQ